MYEIMYDTMSFFQSSYMYMYMYFELHETWQLDDAFQLTVQHKLILIMQLRIKKTMHIHAVVWSLSK